MSDLITSIGAGVKWLLSLFTTFLGTVQEHPVMLYGILLSIVVAGIAIVFRVMKGFGLRSRRR